MNLHGILNKGQGRRRVERQVAMLAAVGVAMLGGIATAITASASANVDHKVWVCKYVGTPGDGERLQIASQDNQNPHSVDANATDSHGDLVVGAFFNDAQGRSYVLAIDTGQDQPDLSGCPGLAQLKLLKVVVGGEAAADEWTLNAAGPSSFAAGSTGVQHAVEAGTYTLSETGGPAHYSPSLWACDNTTGKDTTATIGAIGTPNVTCTITNTFVPSDKEVTPQASATLGSCDAAGHVTLGDNRGYSWSENTGTANGPTYTAKANAGYKLIGTGVFTFHGLSKIASTSPACLAPPAVLGVVENAPVVAGVVENAPAVKSLAFTGAETIPLGLAGLLALVLGAVLTVASRQRPKQARE